MQLQPGVWISPVVRLVRPLGKGGMSRVWVAAHMRLHTQVAVKVLAHSLCSNAEYRARFYREARLWSLINSPHLVQTYDCAELEDGTPFMVMEWLEGETVRSRLQRAGRLSPTDTLVVIKQLARALTSAHDAGIVHRDLKPDNLFLLRTPGTPLLKVLDFGVAKRLESASFDDSIDVSTPTDDSLGTPSYMSPEQLREAFSVDRHADLWSLAVLAYELFSGRLPFDATDYPSLCFSILQGQFTPLSTFDPAWRPLDPWFDKSFAVDIDERYHSAVHAFSELEGRTEALGGVKPAGAPLPLGPATDEVDDPDTDVRDEDTIPR
ncbi:MAG: serine/threonine-protein kinase [Myxococcota bacterium]